MQRLFDLLGIASGLAKIGQASVQGAYKHIEYCLKTSSVGKPVLDKIDERCSGCSLSGEQTQKPNKNIGDDKDDISMNKQDLSTSNNSSSLTSNKANNEKGGPTSTPFRPHTTYAKIKALSNINNLNQRKYHTSSIALALTSEDLAKLAKLKQTRTSSKKDVKTEPKLSPHSKEKRVPSSRIGRISSFGGLAAGLALGTLSNFAKKTVGYSQSDDSSEVVKGSALLSESNLNRIVNTLCTVRGAALKLGQMLSIQDSSIIDPKLLEIFDRVRQSADFMPASQMKKVLVEEFGEDWRSRLKEFDEKPFAAASIGQVHRAVLHDGTEVAMKIQYPGVAESIDSDINNLVTVLKFWKVFPEQLFIDKFIDVARAELTLECDYIREAEFSEKFRKKLKEEEIYGVPKVLPELSGKKVITSQLVSGVPIDQVAKLDQDDKNFVAAAVLRLVLRELFEFRCMQTDPNWSNFLYDEAHQKLWLLDFGAARFYSKEFVDQYIEIVKGASEGNRDKVLDISKTLGFLTGYESKVMEDAHADAIMILGEPFSTEETFDFSRQSTSNRIMKLVPTFLKHRLTPPPEESYSLHRKLSGAFLIATKLQAQFACKFMFDNVYENYWKDNAHV